MVEYTAKKSDSQRKRLIHSEMVEYTAKNRIPAKQFEPGILLECTLYRLDRANHSPSQTAGCRLCETDA